MSKRVILFVLLYFIPGILYADIWDNSTSSFYTAFYIYFVLPVLVWISNWIILGKSLMRKRISSGIFWAVILANILLALFSLLPLYEDLSSHGKEDGYTLFVLLVLLILPLVISMWSIYVRKKRKYDNDEVA